MKKMFSVVIGVAFVFATGCAAKYPLIVPTPTQSGEELVKMGDESKSPCSALLFYMKALENGKKLMEIPQLNEATTECMVLLPPAKVAQEKEVK